MKNVPSLICLLLVLFLVHPIFSLGAEGQSLGRGSRHGRLRNSPNIFGVTRRSNFHSSSSQGTLSRSLFNGQLEGLYGVRPSWNAGIYSREGIGHNYFGNQTVPSPSGTTLSQLTAGTLKDSESELREFVEEASDSMPGGFAGPGLNRF